MAISDLPGEVGSLSLAWGFATLRRLGVTGLVFVPACSGDVSGLPGPPEFNARAVAGGGAVVSADGEPLGLVPDVTSHGPVDDSVVTVDWRRHPVARFGSLPSGTVAEAERLLIETVQATLSELELLDVARWRDEVADLLAGWRRIAADERLPAGIPERAAQLIDRCARIEELVALARTDDGAAITSGEALLRRESLRPLSAAVRQASAVAWNSGLLPAPAKPR